MANLDKIYLNGLEFYAYHGVFPEENKLGQKFIADVILFTSLQQAGETDDLAHTVNYAEAYEQIKAIMTAAPVQLIETLAERIASALLERHARVQQVQVKVTKPTPPIAGIYHSVAVEVVRER
jgi:dihydroneopterin aldolase